MPCGDYPSSAQLALDDLRQAHAKTVALLCEACGIVHDLDGNSHMSADLRKWWRKHLAEDKKRRDAAREKRELKRLADQALKKLSPEEIEALRVNAGLSFDRKKR